jgi:capsular exopolysaccharide synthesis family protein
MSAKKYTQVMSEFDDDFRLEQILRKFTSNWHWFLVSILVCFSLTYYVLKTQTPLSLITARVLINDPSKGGTTAESKLLGQLGSMASSSLANEAAILKTQYLMERVVRDMKLNITYYNKGTLRDDEVYEPPFIVDLVQPVDTIKTTNFDVNLLPNERIQLISDELDTTLTYSKPLTIKGIGVFQILKAPTKPAEGAYAFSVTSVDKRVESLSAQFAVLPPTTPSAVLDVTLNYPVPKKGEDILKKLLQIYVETNVNDRNRLADSAYAFIQTRLSYLGGELGSLETNIQGFRQKNSITEMSQQSNVLINNSSQYVNELAKVETQLSVLNSLEDYMRSNSKGTSVVPSTLVVSDPLFSSLVEKHNALVMERDRRLMTVTETNPVIVNLNEQIENTNSDMLASLSSSKNSLNITKNGLLQRIRSVEGQVHGVPEKERNYLDLARQQKIKEELFIFLMQKGEETAISKTYNTPNSTNIDPPKSATSPFSPRPIFFYAAGILLGLMLPAAFIYLKYLLNNKVDSKRDIVKKTLVPIIGEIGHSRDVQNLLVGNMTRSAIAEQFRALRTNLSFYLKQPSQNIILVSSGMSGEGKSFASINLANVLALSGKKVLLMELDLRKPSLSTKLGVQNTAGFTTYVDNPKVMVKDIVKPLSIHANMFMISSGPLPNNPAEMLLSARATELFNELRQEFDFIIIDAPPVGVVTDAQLLGDHADFCIYVVRHNFTLKSQLEIVEDLNKNNRMKQLGIVVNDIRVENGNGYGYGYGYNYGSYGQEEGSKGLGRKFGKFFRSK